MKFIVIIPARFNSSRLPGKPLIKINGKPIVMHIMEQAYASGADRVIVATDNKEIFKVIKNAGGEVCLTRSDHQSGTERLQEVIDRYDFPNKQVIVNVQSDEPFVPSNIIYQVANDLAMTEASMTTVAVPIKNTKEAFNSNIVKVVIDTYGYALYFSRATIPWDREKFLSNHKNINYNLLRHVGIYAYRADFIRHYVNWPASPLEKIEILEQLRVLWYGEKIHVTVFDTVLKTAIDTPDELSQI